MSKTIILRWIKFVGQPRNSNLAKIPTVHKMLSIVNLLHIQTAEKLLTFPNYNDLHLRQMNFFECKESEG